jgi:hypothetical protein
LGEKIFDWTIMGGATIILRSLKTNRNKKNFRDRQQFFFIFKIIYEPIIFFSNRFSKIRSINSGRDGFMCESWAKMSNQNLFPLVSD